MDNNIVSKISKFADDTKLCHKARLSDDIIELLKDINKLKDLANKYQMKFNVGKCAVLHIGHNNINGNYNMSKLHLPVTEQQRDLGIIITKGLSGSSKQRKATREYLNSFGRNFKYKNRKTMQPLYKYLVHVHTSNTQYNSVLHIFNET